MESGDITTLFRVFKTTLKMLSDRKYIVKPEQMAMTLEEFKTEGKTYISLTSCHIAGTT